MYIAFKWLLSLSLVMWLAMCSIDAFVKNNIIMTQGGYSNIKPITTNIKKNASITAPNQKKINRVGDSSHNITFLHFFTFVAGALVVTVYNNFNDIVIISKYEFTQIVNTADMHHYVKYIKSVVEIITYHFIRCYEGILHFIIYVMSKLKNPKRFQKQKVNFILLKKMQELNEEKKNLAQLFLTAIRENKNIRLQCQLESVEKRKLMQHIESIEKLIKENKSRYISFQQLYLVTHRENCILKNEIKKLCSDKEEIEKKIIGLISEIYKSKNRELMSYCCQFIVQSKHNPLNTDINAEIKKFLIRPRQGRCLAGQWQLTENSDLQSAGINGWLRFSGASNIAGPLDTIKEVEPLPWEAPKLKGLPGECVWTVKDKDGLIEKLYECDFGSKEDYGDTIRRIREYSVYHDKDCLLDCSNSASNLMSSSRDALKEMGCSDTCTGRRSQKFVTDSEAFKKFMENGESVVNKSLVVSKPIQSE